MLSPKPWKLETCGRLLTALLICTFAGATASGLTRYDPAVAKAARWVCGTLGGLSLACLLAALAVVLGSWNEENFRRRATWLGGLVFAGLNLAVGAQHLSSAGGALRPTLVQVIISTLFFQAAGLALVGWFLRQERETWAGAFGFRREPALAIVKGLALSLLALPMCWLLQLGSVWCLRALHWDAQQQSLVEMLRLVESWPARVYLGLAAVVLAPVAEEVFFRGILYGSLKQLGFPRLALWGSSAFFALIHLNMATFIPLLFLAAACAFLYDRTQNLLAPIATHVIFNAANLALLYLLQYLTP